jgi:hypothetical protein
MPRHTVVRMERKLSSYLRRHHVALLALFVALGGTSYAAVALPANSVGAKQIRKAAVGPGKLRANAIDSSRVRDKSLLAKDFAPGQLPAGPPGPTGVIATGSDSNDPDPNIDLASSPKTVLSATVTTTSKSRIVVTGSVNVSGGASSAAVCNPEIGTGGSFSPIGQGAYVQQADPNDAVLPIVGAAADRPAGTYTVRVQCGDAGSGNARYAAGDLVVVAG